MPDDQPKEQGNSIGSNMRFLPIQQPYRFFQQRLQLSPVLPTMWLFPVQFRLRDLVHDRLLQIIGKEIEDKDLKNFLSQTPPEKTETTLKYSLFTDLSVEPFSNNNQFSVGVQGFGSNSKGSFFVQGTSDRPKSNIYNSFQLNLIPGDIPLVVLHKTTITPQIGVDMQTGSLSPGAKINFENFLLKSVNLQVNNLSYDWKKKTGVDSVTCTVGIVIPGL
jgi:hypothetical protein